MSKQDLHKRIIIFFFLTLLLASLLSCGQSRAGEKIDYTSNSSPYLSPEEEGFFFMRTYNNEGLYYYDLKSNHSVKILHSLWEDGINVHREQQSTHKGKVAFINSFYGVYSYGDRLYFFAEESHEHGFPTKALYSTKKDGSELIPLLTDLPQLMTPMFHRGHLYAKESTKGAEWTTLYDLDLEKGTLYTYDREFSGEDLVPYQDGFLMISRRVSKEEGELLSIQEGKEDLSYPVQAGSLQFYGDDKVLLTTGEGDYTNWKNVLYDLETREQLVMFDDIAHSFVLNDEIIRIPFLIPHLSLKEKRTVKIHSMDGKVLREYKLPLVEKMELFGLCGDYLIVQDQENQDRLVLLHLKTGELILEEFDEE